MSILRFGGNHECGEDTALALRGQASKRKVSILEISSASPLRKGAVLKRRLAIKTSMSGLAFGEVGIRLHFQHLLGVPFAVRGGEQDKLVSVEFAQWAVGQMRAQSARILQILLRRGAALHKVFLRRLR